RGGPRGWGRSPRGGRDGLPTCVPRGRRWWVARAARPGRGRPGPAPRTSWPCDTSVARDQEQSPRTHHLVMDLASRLATLARRRFAAEVGGGPLDRVVEGFAAERVHGQGYGDVRQPCGQLAVVFRRIEAQRLDVP